MIYFDIYIFKYLVLHSMLHAFLITEVLEIGVSFLFPQRNIRDVILIFAVNMITNPAVVFLDFLFHYRFFNPVVWMILLEGTVWIVEALIYRKVLTRKTTNPFLFSFVLNLSSYGIGALIHRFTNF